MPLPSIRIRLRQSDLTEELEEQPTPSYTPQPGPFQARAVNNRPKLPKLTFVGHGKTLHQKNTFIQRKDRPVLPHDPENPFIDHGDGGDGGDGGDLTRHRQKRENQWKRWQEEVIPSLIHPYMTYLSESQSLREPVPVASSTCSCGSGRSIDIILLTFDSLQKIKLGICPCMPSAPLQLLQRGFFACAPLFPSLAVELKVLDFASELFVHIAPNNTAWCKSVERFLARRGYRLQTEGSLRKRFSNSLVWYNALKDATSQCVDELLAINREVLFGVRDGMSVSPDDFYDLAQYSSPAWRRGNDGSTPHTAPPRQPLREHPSNPFPEPQSRTRPSDHLRSRCPLCFGGEFPSSRRENGKHRPDAIICIDACFTQKHNRQLPDPPLIHPRSVFIPEDHIQATARYVDSLRSSNPISHPRDKKKKRLDIPNDDDIYENSDHGTLRVPKSVLDGCEDSFTAADSRRVKASTQFFDETALMAILCRHDVVLFIASMRSAGEKQHYAIALVETLFQHLPHDFHIGLLYDIGCQLERSCIKWNFLDRFIDRITFGISVFHAFGHQWACQIIYHPRKCEGFGLTDGEGCERFWHSISKLIPYLRVCGYHQRIYTLNRQVEHATNDIQESLAAWLTRRFQHTQTKKKQAEDRLRLCRKSVDYLRAEWKAQIAAQTKPLPRQSKPAGKNAITELMRLHESRDALKTQITELNLTLLQDDDIGLDYHAQTMADLAETRIRLKDLNARIRHKETGLGIDERAELKLLMSNPYISTMLNALAVKQRLRDRLRSRKFELDRVERSFRKQVNDQKVDNHTEASVKRRDPSITKVAGLYNQLQSQLEAMVAKGVAPPGAVPPHKIETKGLFTLDVDDAIWQDVGLTDDVGSLNLTPPAWLADNSVRDGIRALLEHDRCIEEGERIRHECQSMRLWFMEEWSVVNRGVDRALTDGIRYYLNLRRDTLLRYCTKWKDSISLLYPDQDELFSDWGISGEDMAGARAMQTLEAVDEERDMSDDDEDNSVLVETLEALELADAFRTDGDEEYFLE
ncbi:hypothetical protein H0H92_014854 [Tricholoma furcatifolium]|nr:hypothetical protein H0H92_014854 [Tricholoma furcatifolium]